MNNESRLYVYAAASAAVMTAAVVTYLDVRREERAKRKEIRRNMYLDLHAIHNASETLEGMIESGQIRSVSQLADAVQNEVAFAKIAIREDS